MPSPIRRRVRPVGPTAAKIYSTSRGTQTRHTVKIDEKTGRVSCSCEDFKYRHAQFTPTVFDSTHWCKHILQFSKYLVRKNAA